ncbi:putative F-box/LRR-repeat protein 23 [Panicum virgatum]|uniref:putative F-box/LRR-repeat protein 23 n=1 Tax=Panicum virgatum TaxID=38727 RepID=UPI0019D595CA|nr:putative F-box/LRR-repeat protein 23 [Panicum virgatum]
MARGAGLQREVEWVQRHLGFHTGLPPELISCILHRLDPIQIMLGADKVCRPWRCAARDEPELWRRIDMRGHEALSDRSLVDLNQMATDAMRHGREQCQAAPSLKILVLDSCREVSGPAFTQAIRGFPLLEELELSNYRQAQHEGVFQAVAKECPRLRCLRNHRVKSLYYYGWDHADDGEAMAIAEMHELRSLQLLNNDLSNQGLAAILDKCLHLEWLDVRECRHLRMDPQLQARIGAKKLVTKYMDEERENMEPGSPNTECSTCLNYLEPDKERYRRKRCVDDMEAKVISTVYELRSLELHCNDLTSEGLAAILDNCPQLESLDVWNCLNIVMNNNALHADKRGWVKTKKLTTKLLTDYSNYKFFNPEGLNRHNCRNIILKNFRNVFLDHTQEGK